MYKPNFEQDFIKHIPNKLKQVYMEYLIKNIGLFADSEKNEKKQQFLFFLISRESLELIRKNGPVILYDDINLKGVSDD
jgi:hypothetical protein